MARLLNAPVLFLDFDGVLHPDAVYLSRKRGIELRAEGDLFQWVSLLEAPLAAAPATQVVLSTSWVKALQYDTAKRYLPAWLQARIVGGTWHTRFLLDDGAYRWWDDMTRYEQIAHYLNRRSVLFWVALDNDATDWAPRHRAALVKTDDWLGLAESGKAEELRRALVANEAAWLAASSRR